MQPIPSLAPSSVVAPASILSQSREGTYRATLPNGKEIIAFIVQKHRAKFPEFLPTGTQVTVQLPTYDFSAGAILSVELTTAEGLY